MKSRRTLRHLSLSDWRAASKRVPGEIIKDRVPAVAAGLAFYTLLASVPVFVALVAVYSLAADASDIQAHIRALSPFVPATAREVMLVKLEGFQESSRSGLSMALITSVFVALVVGSGGAEALLRSLSVAYNTKETRSFFRLRFQALWLTALFIFGVSIGLGVIGLIPYLVTIGILQPALEQMTWPALLIGGAVVLATLYRHGPNRPAPPWQLMLPGGALAMMLWFAASAGLRFYVITLGRYSEVYGPLGGVVVAMLWFQLSAMAVLCGAELNAELEKQIQRKSDDLPRPVSKSIPRATETISEQRFNGAERPAVTPPHTSSHRPS